MSKNRRRLAFSYIRFSSLRQAAGNSLARQVELSRAYCERHGLTLDESLTLQDLGVSAFRGDNVKEGALAGFLEACRSGRVPRDSVLIVESLDRLSRDQIRPALQLFLALQDYGITIVTLQPEREYKPDDTDALTLIEPLIVFARAHEESAIKSHRRRDGWKRAKDKARQSGAPLTRMCPAWLEVTPEGFRVKEEAAEAVRSIYRMAREGLGVHRITTRLARDGVRPIGLKGRWVKAYVYHILAHPAAMGSYQPSKLEGRKLVPDGDPVPNFYPAVVSAEDWHAAEAAIQRRAGGFRKGGPGSPAAGRKGAEETNLFSGLVRVATSGEKMHLVHARGREIAGVKKKYLYLCETLEVGSPRGVRIDYHVFEAAVLSLLKELRPADVTGDAGGGTRREEVARLSGRLLDIDSRLERARQRARTAGDFDAFLGLIEDLHAERKRVSERRAELEQEEKDNVPADLGETQTLASLVENARAGPEREDLRRRLKGRLALLLDGVWAVIVRRGKTCVCGLQLRFRNAGSCRDYLIVHRPGTRHGPGRWFARSLAGEAGGLDLRRPDHAKRLEAVLKVMVME